MLQAKDTKVTIYAPVINAPINEKAMTNWEHLSSEVTITLGGGLQTHGTGALEGNGGHSSGAMCQTAGRLGCVLEPV